VVCAARYEPVSTCNSLLSGKLTGNFTIFGLLEAISVRKTPVPQRFPGKFPAKINRENILKNREFLSANREFRATDGKRRVFAVQCVEDRWVTVVQRPAALIPTAAPLPVGRPGSGLLRSASPCPQHSAAPPAARTESLGGPKTRSRPGERCPSRRSD
jgi:hypothetical protein